MSKSQQEKINKDNPVHRKCLHVLVMNDMPVSENISKQEQQIEMEIVMKRVLTEADVIVTTCSNSACLELQTLSFQTIIIDECSQVLLFNISRNWKKYSGLKKFKFFQTHFCSYFILQKLKLFHSTYFA